MSRAGMPRASLLAALVLSGCIARSPRAPSSPPPAVDVEAFERGEDEVLRDLAAIDKRFARRTQIEPSEQDLHRVALSAILNEDPTLAVNDGTIDTFSFDARARGLAAVRKRLATLPDLEPERELLGRVVDSELARLEEERALPRSASALVRAVVDTWTPPKDEREAADDDRWLARRLRELRESMVAPAAPNLELDVVRARDLDDALDALERVASGMVKSTQELVKTREALEGLASRPAAVARSDWSLVAQRLRAHVGVGREADELARSFDQLEKELRARADEAVTAAGLDRRALPGEIEKQLFTTGACVIAVPGSRVRSLAAPQEREAVCHLRRVVAGASDARGRALALATMHDHVVVAEWALEVARGKGTLEQAEGRHHMLLPLVQPSVRARLERIALARPVAAIGAGVAVGLLAKGDPESAAKAWMSLGDVPLDVAERELRPRAD